MMPSPPFRSTFVYLMKLAWKSRWRVPLLLTLVVYILDIRVQFEVNMTSARRRAQQLGIGGDNNNQVDNFSDRSINSDDVNEHDDDDDDIVEDDVSGDDTDCDRMEEQMNISDHSGSVMDILSLLHVDLPKCVNNPEIFSTMIK